MGSFQTNRLLPTNTHTHLFALLCLVTLTASLVCLPPSQPGEEIGLSPEPNEDANS